MINDERSLHNCVASSHQLSTLMLVYLAHLCASLDWFTRTKILHQNGDNLYDRFNCFIRIYQLHVNFTQRLPILRLQNHKIRQIGEFNRRLSRIQGFAGIERL